MEGSKPKMLPTMLASMMSMAGFPVNKHIPGSGRAPKRGMGRKNPHMPYKPAFSMGYRGASRTISPCGSVAAPTIDQVRKIEQAYMCRIHVRRGLLYFKGTDTAFTPERGLKHRALRMAKLSQEVCNAETAIT